MDNIEALNFLTGSAARWRILMRLFEGPTDFGTLREDLEVPQSTLNRNLTKLEEEGWVREDEDRTYRLTALGGFFVDRIEPLEDVMTVVERLADYPDAFPLEDFDFDPARLADGDWRTVSETEPYAVINRVRAIIEGCTTIKAFRPHYMPAYIDVTATLMEKEGSDIVGIVPDHQIDAAVEDEDFDVGEYNAYPELDFRVWDGDTDYAMAIVDDEMVILTGDHAGGMPSVLVESTDESVLAWARETFQEKYDRSVPVEEAV